MSIEDIQRIDDIYTPFEDSADNMDPFIFWLRVEEFRNQNTEKKITNTDIGKVLGVSHQRVSTIIKERNKRLTSVQLRDLCRLLDCSYLYLLGKTYDPYGKGHTQLTELVRVYKHLEPERLIEQIKEDALFDREALLLYIEIMRYPEKKREIIIKAVRRIMKVCAD